MCKKTQDLFETLTHLGVWKQHRLDKVRWRRYRQWSLYVRLLWRIAGTHMKKRAWCPLDTPHNSQRRHCDKAIDSSTEPSPGKCVESGELYFLYADPTPVIPHCASPLMVSQILVKSHCNYKQLRTCHIDRLFRDILAGGWRITTNVTAFFSILKMRPWFWCIFSFILRYYIVFLRKMQIFRLAFLSAPVNELR